MSDLSHEAVAERLSGATFTVHVRANPSGFEGIDLAKYATIDQYISALPKPLREVATDTRRVIDKHLKGADSAIKWAHPTWSLGKQPVCYLKAASKHVTFGFWRGAAIDDPSGRLESSGEVMAHTKLRTREDVDEKLFARWLRQAREFERSV